MRRDDETMPPFAGWEGQGGRPPMGSLWDPADIRMYPPASVPRAAALSSDGASLDGPWHRHDMHQLLYSLEGSLEIEIASGRHLVPSRLAAWIPAGVVHRVSLHQVRWGSIFLPAAAIADAGDRVRTILVSRLMREMALEALRWPPHGRDSALRTSFFRTFAGLAEEWIDDETDLYLPGSSDPRVQRALDRIGRQPTVRLSALCDQAAMSERSFRRHLRLTTGLTVERYRARVRILKAISLLSEGTLSIAQIAQHCGFENQSAFARAFRNMMKVSPGAYRNRQQGIC